MSKYVEYVGELWRADEASTARSDVVEVGRGTTLATRVTTGVGLGLLSLYYFASLRDGPGSSKRARIEGWPEVPALATGTSIMGSALSFLLVFRLSWSFGRWWEARGLVGTAMTKVRNVATMLTANADAPTPRRGRVPSAAAAASSTSTSPPGDSRDAGTLLPVSRARSTGDEDVL